jgi:mannose/fructose/N-acetylgalactosamine-specific phosphotransferase system component IIB
MGVVLVRIDDRLVHGQVIEGWLRSIRATYIVVANDQAAADETHKALFWLGVPQGIGFSCLSLAEAASAWKGKMWGKDNVLVLLASPQDALWLLEQGVPLHSLNVGGLHFREGRVQVLKAISVDEADVQTFKALSQKGVLLEARALPLDEPVDLAVYLERWQKERESLQDQPR